MRGGGGRWGAAGGGGRWGAAGGGYLIGVVVRSLMGRLCGCGKYTAAPSRSFCAKGRPGGGGCGLGDGRAMFFQTKWCPSDPEIAALKRVMASVDRASQHQNQKDTEGFKLLHEAANTGEMEIGLTPSEITSESEESRQLQMTETWSRRGTEKKVGIIDIIHASHRDRRQGTVNNETPGYLVGRVYPFQTRLGIDKGRLSFREHVCNEMASSAANCWNPETEFSYGWVESVGIPDRSAYDLKAHSDKSGLPLVAHEKFSKPREVEEFQAYSTVGIADYASLEVQMKKGCPMERDWWSHGAIMYEMLVGYALFHSEDPMSICRKIVNGRSHPKFSEEARLSPQDKDLINKLLCNVDHIFVTYRSHMIRAHQWFRRVELEKLYQMEAPFIPEVIDELDSQNFENFEETTLPMLNWTAEDIMAYAKPRHKKKKNKLRDKDAKVIRLRENKEESIRSSSGGGGSSSGNTALVGSSENIFWIGNYGHYARTSMQHVAKLLSGSVPQPIVNRDDATFTKFDELLKENLVEQILGQEKQVTVVMGTNRDITIVAALSHLTLKVWGSLYFTIGEEIKSKRALTQYLKANPGGPAPLEFNWGTGNTLRQSSRLSGKAKATASREDDKPPKLGSSSSEEWLSRLKIQNAAEGNIKQFKEQSFPQFLQALSAELSNDNNKQKCTQRWISVDPAVKSQVKGSLLMTLGSPVSDAQHSSSQVIAKIASIEIPHQGWPELIVSFLVNAVLTAVVQGINHVENNSRVRLAAARNYIMKVVSETAISKEADIKKAAFECLISIESTYYDILVPYMADEEQVALQAIEFWSTICDEEVAEESGDALPLLVLMLLETLLKQEGDQDGDDLIWNISMAGGTCLWLVGTSVKDAIVPLPDWHSREAATFAFVSILEDFSVEKLAPLFPHSPTSSVSVVINANLPHVIEIMLTSIKDSPNVAEKICGSLYFLAHGYENAGPMSSVLLCASAYETLNEIVGCSSIADTLNMVAFEFQIASSEDKEKQSDRQALLCGVVQFADQIMVLFLREFSCDSSNVHEEAMLAISALAYTTGPEFVKYMPEFHKYLEMGLQILVHIKYAVFLRVCLRTSVMPSMTKVLPYCDGIMSALLKDLSRPELHYIALTTGGHFEKNVPYTLPMLQGAAWLCSLMDLPDDDSTEYKNELRRTIFRGLFRYTSGSQSSKSELMVLYAGNIFQFAELVLRETSRDEGLTKAGVALVGDLTDALGPSIKLLLKNSNFHSELLGHCSQSDDEQLRASSLSAQKQPAAGLGGIDLGFHCFLLRTKHTYAPTSPGISDLR
ncbi:hypothetical protein ZWY2020_027345 [Hordeum vulgare]|nr:hypothetical protein ZWY2020_027345 [Hordeum vulgare]